MFEAFVLGAIGGILKFVGVMLTAFALGLLLFGNSLGWVLLIAGLGFGSWGSYLRFTTSHTVRISDSHKEY